jgi:hypothetical protein
VFRQAAIAVISCVPGFSTLSAGDSLLWAGQQEQQQAPVDKPAGDGAAQGATTTTQTKPADKPKKVITNDDIKSSPYAGFGGLFYFYTGSINDCDANCFEQVRGFSGQYQATENNPSWRREVLQQIELVRSDSEWQLYRRQLYEVHNRICHVNFDEQDELRRAGSSRNMGPQQIEITEKYEAKRKQARGELDALVGQQAAPLKKFEDKPYAKGFAMLQATRMPTGFSTQAKMIYPQ